MTLTSDRQAKATSRTPLGRLGVVGLLLIVFAAVGVYAGIAPVAARFATAVGTLGAGGVFTDAGFWRLALTMIVFVPLVEIQLEEMRAHAQ